MMKNKVARITVIIVVFGLLSGFTGYKIRKTYLNNIKNMGYTEYALTPHELYVLNWYADISIPEYVEEGRPQFLDENEYNKDKDDFELAKGAKTEEFVAKLNHVLFDLEKDSDLKIIASQYGINENNPFTSDWIMTHPKEFAAIRYEDVHGTFKKITTGGQWCSL